MATSTQKFGPDLCPKACDPTKFKSPKASAKQEMAMGIDGWKATMGDVFLDASDDEN